MRGGGGGGGGGDEEGEERAKGRDSCLSTL